MIWSRPPQYQAAVAFGCATLPFWAWVWMGEVEGPQGTAKVVAFVMAPLCAFLPVLMPFDLYARWQRWKRRRWGSRAPSLSRCRSTPPPVNVARGALGRGNTAIAYLKKATVADLDRPTSRYGRPRTETHTDFPCTALTHRADHVEIWPRNKRVVPHRCTHADRREHADGLWSDVATRLQSTADSLNDRSAWYSTHRPGQKWAMTQWDRLRKQGWLVSSVEPFSEGRLTLASDCSVGNPAICLHVPSAPPFARRHTARGLGVEDFRAATRKSRLFLGLHMVQE